MSRFSSLSAVVCIFFVSELHARKGGPPRVLSTSTQALAADLAAVGKVVAVERDIIKSTLEPNGPEVSLQVVTIKVAESLSGSKGLTHVRVAFVPSNERDDPFSTMHNLVEGQTGCFFLNKHHQLDCYVQFPNGKQLRTDNQDYLKELTTVRKITAALSDPLTALKAKEAADRQIAACALIIKYRTQPAAPKGERVVEEEIPAEESKLILAALGEMKWGQLGPEGFSSLERVFWQLNPKNGWKEPQAVNGQDFNKLMTEAIGRWVKENGDKFRIERYVVLRSMK